MGACWLQLPATLLDKLPIAINMRKDKRAAATIEYVIIASIIVISIVLGFQQYAGDVTMWFRQIARGGAMLP